MAYKSAVAVAGIMLLAACGKHQPTLTKDAVADAARACGARGVVFVPAEVAAEAPYIRVVDRTAVVNGKRIDVPRCVSAKLSAYHYGRMVLDAAPAGNTT